MRRDPAAIGVDANGSKEHAMTLFLSGIRIA